MSAAGATRGREAGGPVLELAGVSRAFPTPRGPLEVLRSVNLSLAPGDFALLTGPSGSGKTTLLHLAALLDSPTAGAVRVEGRDASAMDEEARCAVRRSRIGMVFQQFHLLPHRSVLANVLFRFRYAEEPPDARETALALLDGLGLAALAHRPARLLSAGEMQRTAIARAVVHPPALLLADEPTGNLDRAAARDAMACFRDLNARGLTLLMATHNEELLAYATRHFVCRGGEVVPA